MSVYMYIHHPPGNAERTIFIFFKKNYHFFQINYLDNLYSLKDTGQIYDLILSLFTKTRLQL